MTIDPVQSLAFSIQSNPGVYALLLGSGVSRPASIPTGWEIVFDLIGKLASATEQGPVADPEKWYVDNHGEAPDYSQLLDSLVKTQSERQQLLSPYFEPNDEEHEQGLKQPTPAHRAIARLVAKGFVKVIVTTNFDRLTEKALEDEGVVPRVLSTPEQVQGSPPLVHMDCCVFKVHGDYKDTRTLNTQQELDEYPLEVNQLLDRIFNEYGLIVCGWSAEWDTALRNAMFRAQSRRFTTYWAAHGTLTDQAERLIEHRDAQVIPIRDADGFFQTIQNNVESIEEYSKPHPLSTAAAVESLKRFMPRAEYRIQLSDLVDAAFERVIGATNGENFDPLSPDPTKWNITARLRRYDSVCETLLAMSAVAGRWADGEDDFQVWERGSQRLSTKAQLPSAYNPLWLALKLYPGLLNMYTLGLSAVESGNLHFINRIFRRTVLDNTSGVQSTSNILLTLVDCLSALGYLRERIERMENDYLPVNTWIYETLREPLKSLIPDDEAYTYVFDKFEILIALTYASIRYGNSSSVDRFPFGLYMWRPANRQLVLNEIEQSIQTDSQSPYLATQMFGDTFNDYLQMAEQFKAWVPSASRQLGIFV